MTDGLIATGLLLAPMPPPTDHTPTPQMERIRETADRGNVADEDAPEITYTAADLDRLIIRNVGGLDQNDKRLVLELTERMRQAGRDRTIGGRRSDAEENPSKGGAE